MGATACVRTRARTSAAPPAAKGTTTVTGLLGKGLDCACAVPEARTKAVLAATERTRRISVFMDVSL